MEFQPNLILNIVEPESLFGYKPRLITHYMGPVQQSITTASNNCVFFAHHSGTKARPFSGPVKKLTFTQIGTRDIPDLSQYADTCEVVEFTGYVCMPISIFQIVSQLPKVSTVDIYISAAEQYSTMLSPLNARYFPLERWCLGVKSVRIIVDLQYYHGLVHHCNGELSRCSNPAGCPTKIKSFIGHYALTLIRHAKDAFPHHFFAHLPENKNLTRGLLSLIKSYTGLGQDPQVTFKNIWPRGITAEFHPPGYREPLIESSRPLEDSDHSSSDEEDRSSEPARATEMYFDALMSHLERSKRLRLESVGE